MGRYASIGELRLALRAPTSADARSWQDTTFTDQLASVIDTAERLIDAYCGWSFDAPSTEQDGTLTVSTQTVIGEGSRVGSYVVTPPIADGENVTITSDNGAVTIPSDMWSWAHEGYPNVDAWRHIYLPHRWAAPIAITAAFGWPGGPPSGVKSAAIMWASHLFTLESTPLGAQAFDFGAITVAHRPRGVDGLLEPYRDVPGGVVVG